VSARSGEVHFQAELALRAKASQDRLNKILGADTDEDERINDLTDRIVDEVLTKFGLK
jgi:hypothetical protein